jgi:hypothetical protein
VKRAVLWVLVALGLPALVVDVAWGLQVFFARHPANSWALAVQSTIAIMLAVITGAYVVLTAQLVRTQREGPVREETRAGLRKLLEVVLEARSLIRGVRVALKLSEEHSDESAKLAAIDLGNVRKLRALGREIESIVDRTVSIPPMLGRTAALAAVKTTLGATWLQFYFGGLQRESERADAESRAFDVRRARDDYGDGWDDLVADADLEGMQREVDELESECRTHLRART